MKLQSTLLCALALVGLAVDASASSGYSNLTPSGTYSNSGYVVVSGSSAAVPITLAADARLVSIDLPVESALPGSGNEEYNQFTVSLAGDASGLPGATLEDLGLHTALPSISSQTALLTVPSGDTPLLEAGVTYWIVCSADKFNEVWWPRNLIGEANYAFKPFQSGWQLTTASSTPALRVNTSPVGPSVELAGNLAPSGTHQIGPAWSVTGANGFGGSISRAASFVLAQDATLESLQLPVLNALFGGTDDVRIELKEDSSGVPSTLVEDLGVHSGFPLHGSTTSGQSTFPSVAKPTLLAGTTYWIVCSAAHADTWVRWAPNDKGAQGQIGTGSAGSWTVQNGTELALQVDGHFFSAQSYCTAGVSASGCQATLSAPSAACANAIAGFVVVATGVEGAKDGVFFYGTNGRQANSWGNGTSYQCVVPPVKRAGMLNGSGTPGACNGTFSQDLNVLWSQNPQKNPGAGTVVQAQLWYRDPLNTSNQTTSLSNAIEFAVLP
jgi:hypothetical protein